MTEGEDESSVKLAVVDTSMVEASFTDLSKEESQNAIIDKDKVKGQNDILYPTWVFKTPIRRLDFDDFNSVLNL